jgi:tetratricopeptide (TPR) repeat protein
MVKVDFHLRRTAAPEPATALLLTSHSVQDVVKLCGRCGCEKMPLVYVVADGFLLKLPQAAARPVAGVIQLRSLCENLLLPVDAELVPTLLNEEASALVQGRGLIFLPGGRVLAFAPDHPVSFRTLLRMTGVRRRPWQPLPDAPGLAHGLREIVVDLPQEPPEAIVEAGGEGVGLEQPRPEDSTFPAKLLGKAAVRLGSGLARMGKSLNLTGLAWLGAQFVAKGLSLAPRLSESLLGKQEAALRRLLREFRHGNLEWALRHALPLGGLFDRGAVHATDARLPTHSLWFSLADILQKLSGPVYIWFSRGNIEQELEKEYRKQAEAATQRGDYRRAAFIYAKLLHDYRLAANVLFQGGLYLDAAILYLRKVGDALAAARAYEAAGDFDRALSLYRQQRDHERAADLLRRLGEEELAVAEYQVAAERLVELNQGYYAAGELMLRRALRPELAIPYFQAGWQLRARANAPSCAIRLAQLYAQRSAPSLLQLLAEAEEYLQPVGNDSVAAEFFNEVARLADEPLLADMREDLRDRALLGIAGKLRERARAERPGDRVSRMMGLRQIWAAPVVSDAEFAVKAATKLKHRPTRAGGFATTIIQGRVVSVTAVGWAAASGDVVLGFASGEVVCFRPAHGEVIYLSPDRRLQDTMEIVIATSEPLTPQYSFDPVISLAASADGRLIFAVWASGHMASFARRETATYGCVESRHMVPPNIGWLTPLVVDEEQSQVWQSLLGLWNGDELQFLRSALLIPAGSLPMDHPVCAALLVPGFARRMGGEPTTIALFAFGGGALSYYMNCLHKRCRTKTLGWTPGLPQGSSLMVPGLAWMQTGPGEIEFATLQNDGTLYWAKVGVGPDAAVEHEAHCLNRPASPRYLAATIVRPRVVAAVSATEIDWLRCGASGPPLRSSTKISFPSAVACFPYASGNELIVVSREGTVACIPLSL